MEVLLENPLFKWRFQWQNPLFKWRFYWKIHCKWRFQMVFVGTIDIQLLVNEVVGPETQHHVETHLPTPDSAGLMAGSSCLFTRATISTTIDGRSESSMEFPYKMGTEWVKSYHEDIEGNQHHQHLLGNQSRYPRCQGFDSWPCGFFFSYGG